MADRPNYIPTDEIWKPYDGNKWPSNAPDNAWFIRDNWYHDQYGRRISPYTTSNQVVGWIEAPATTVKGGVSLTPTGVIAPKQEVDWVEIPNDATYTGGVVLKPEGAFTPNNEPITANPSPWADFGVLSNGTLVQAVQYMKPNSNPVIVSTARRANEVEIKYREFGSREVQTVRVPKSYIVTIDESAFNKQVAYEAAFHITNTKLPFTTFPVNSGGGSGGNGGNGGSGGSGGNGGSGGSGGSGGNGGSGGSGGSGGGDSLDGTGILPNTDLTESGDAVTLISSKLQDYIDSLEQPTSSITERIPLPPKLNDSQLLAIETDCPILWKISSLPIEQQLKIMLIVREHARNLQTTRRIYQNGQKQSYQNLPRQQRQGALRKQRKTRKRGRQQTSPKSQFQAW